MQRNSSNLRKYNETCKEVVQRADECCEVMLDENGDACSELPKVRRCARRIPYDQARRVNFLHRATRNGKSDEWVLSTDSIIFGCDEHHYEEGRTGLHVESVTYDENELSYIPEV